MELYIPSMVAGSQESQTPTVDVRHIAKKLKTHKAKASKCKIYCD